MAQNREHYDKERAFLRDLLVACEKDEVEKVKSFENDLKKKNISVCDYKDGNKSGAIHAAARGGSLKTLEYLLSLRPEQGALLDARNRTPLMAACTSDESAECVRYLLEKNSFARDSINLSSDGVACVHLAACLNSEKTLKYLLELGGADPNMPSNAGSPLHWAAGHAHTGATTKLLLSTGKVDINGRDPMGCTPVISACLRGSSEIVKVLCDAGADLTIFAKNMSALIGAAVSGNLECAKIIVEKGGDELCMVRDPEEHLLPIEHAAHAGQKDIISFLAEKSGMNDVDATSYIRKIQTEYEEMIKRTMEAEQAADASASQIKEEGNKLFADKKFSEAITKYEAALQVPQISSALRATLLSNISASYLRNENAVKARDFANQACAANPKYPKAFFRLGQACSMLNDHEEAARAFWDAYNLDTKSKEAPTYLKLFKQNIDAGKIAYAEKQKKGDV